uniref:Uncharacterized protein n=1 Tax=Vespula pensylvanica TaxID=30213 RepID=A0A834JTJ1_VESPE|nr:hypothetical protein H0235_016939 [Vespula pensylvanica]
MGNRRRKASCKVENGRAWENELEEISRSMLDFLESVLTFYGKGYARMEDEESLRGGLLIGTELTRLKNTFEEKRTRRTVAQFTDTSINNGDLQLSRSAS